MIKRKKQNSAVSTNYDNTLLGKKLSFAASEAYKLLRTNLDFSLPDENGCKIIGITSAMHGEGKTTTSINVAYSMAQTGKLVLLVEADMRLPNIARRLKLNSSPGLSNLLVGQNRGENILQPSGMLDNLWVVTAGDIPPNPAELLGSQQMDIAVEKFAEKFDVIIIDLPPVAVVSDALMVSKLVGGMAVVVRQNMCTRSAVSEVIRQLKFSNVKILGFIVTGSDVSKKSYKKYGSGSYGYGYESAAK